MPKKTNVLLNKKVLERTDAAKVSSFLMNEILYKSYEDFKKQFASEQEMGQAIVDCINIIRRDDEYRGDYADLRNTFEEMGAEHFKRDNYIDRLESLQLEPSSFGSDRIYGYEIFNQRLKRALGSGDDTVDTSGEGVYRMLKDAIAYGERQVTRHFAKTNEHFNELYKEGYAETAKKCIGGLCDLLENGNETLRGSSKEYKEIQRELKALKESLKTSDMKTHKDFVVSIKAIAEKADRYVKNRKEVFYNSPRDSYKGKRVWLMKDVSNNCNAMLDLIVKDAKIRYSEQVEKECANGLIKNFDKNTFSMTRYMEVRKVKLGEDKAALDPKMKKVLNDVLSGTHVSFAGVEKIRENIKDFMEKVDGAKNLERVNELYAEELRAKKSGKGSGSAEADEAFAAYRKNVLKEMKKGFEAEKAHEDYEAGIAM